MVQLKNLCNIMMVQKQYGFSKSCTSKFKFYLFRASDMSAIHSEMLGSVENLQYSVRNMNTG